MSDPIDRFQKQLLEYFRYDDWAARGYQPTSSIFNQIKLGGRANHRFSEDEIPKDEHRLGLVLEHLRSRGYLRIAPATEGGEPSYQATEWYISRGSIDVNDAEVARREFETERIPLNSGAWTGMPKRGVLSSEASDRLSDALKLVEDAIEKSQASNEERAQARAYLIALHALAEAPNPPAELIWNILQVAAALAGVGSLFVAILALYG